MTEEENVAYNLAKVDKIGTPDSRNGNYPLGWAQAANTPFRYWKSDANSEGGTHDPLIVYWPKGIKDKGGIRTQYSHVIDLLPTTLDLVGIKAPEEIRGIKQQAIEGTSLAYSIDDAKAPTRHTLQYYYIFGSRSIYDNGWKAELAYPNDVLTKHVLSNPPLDENAWELYNLNDDPTERIDLAQKYPEKLAKLKAEYEEQAQSHHLYPYITFDDMYAGRTHHTYLPQWYLDRQKAQAQSSNSK
jgi:arylsulfatase